MDPSAIVSPFIAYVNGGGTYDDVSKLIASRVAECMQSQGWFYVPESEDGVKLPASPATFGELDKFRREEGFGIAKTSERTNTENNRYRESLDRNAIEAYSLALFGSGGEGASYAPGQEEGCLPRASSAVAEISPTYRPDVYGALAREYQTLVLANPQYIDALAQWRKCFHSSGFDADSPENVPAVVESLSLEGANESASEVELLLASFEWSCYLQHLAQLRVALEAAAVQQLVESGLFPEPVDLSTLVDSTAGG